MSVLIKYIGCSGDIKSAYMCDNCLLVLTKQNLPVYKDNAQDPGRVFIPAYCMRCGVKFDSILIQNCNQDSSYETYAERSDDGET